MRFTRQLRHIGVAVATVALMAVSGASAQPLDTRMHVLTVGNGVVISTDGLVRCSARCSAGYERGATVTLTALPDRYFDFESWSGDCVGSAPKCIVALDRHTWVGAVFRRKAGLVRLVVSGPGVIISEPIKLASGALGAVCGQDSGLLCERPFEQGTIVKLRRRGLRGGGFETWGGACAGFSGDCGLFVDEKPREVSAAFRHAVQTPGPHTLTVRLIGNDRLTSEPPGIECPPTCTASFPTGTLVTLSVPRRYLWSRGACVGIGSSCTLVIDSSVDVEARLSGYGGSPPPPPAPGKRIGVNVSVSGGGVVRGREIQCGESGGTYFDYCKGYFREGSTVVLQAFPARDGRFGRWDGFCRGKKPRCRLRVTAPKIVLALFRR